ncbi:MAG: AzlD domain-containing protein, partial [Clostridia bacterium]|nr:AzlD domain-containing protein [Clostridia bacterium]
MNTAYLLSSIGIMALVTYIIRATPLIVFRKRIKNKWIQSFLYYVPYVVLSAMTFPAVFYSTGSIISAVGGCLVAIVLA